MQDSVNNMFFPNGDCLIEMAADEPTNLEPYLNNENAELSEPSHELKLPEVIGILPLRNVVAYPGTVTPLAVGRERSKRLLAETAPNESIIGLATQRSQETDKPGFDEIYSVGTAASVLKVIKLPQ